MKLYYSPGACSLSDHIALIEAGLEFEAESVDLKHKITASGADFNTINPKGYVPALVLDDGQTVTENVAILDWIAAQSPVLGLTGPLGRTRVLEALAYISDEIHKSFTPFFTGAGDEEKAKAAQAIAKRLQLLSNQLRGEYLFGSRPTVADYFLFVMLRWAAKYNVPVSAPLAALRNRLLGRAAVQAALKVEGLSDPLPAASERSDKRAATG